MSRHCNDKKHCCIGIPGAPGAPGATGATGNTGAPGGTSSYGYAFNLPSQILSNNSYVAFSVPGKYVNITGPAAGGTDFKITAAGDYMYDFRIFGVPEDPSTNIDFGLSLNGFSNIVGGSVNHFTVAVAQVAGSVTGHGIATFSVGDIVRLTSFSGSVTLLTPNSNPPSFNASLRLVKIG